MCQSKRNAATAAAAGLVAAQTRFAQQRWVLVNDKHRMQVKCLLICIGLGLGLLMLTAPFTEARRGRGRGRTKSRVQIGLPITGKYRDPESDQYYNNNNVS